MNCQNKDRKHCLMYDESFCFCKGLKNTAGSKNCVFFKDKRCMSLDDVKEYREGCRNGFRKEEAGNLSAYAINGNHRKGLVRDLW